MWITVEHFAGAINKMLISLTAAMRNGIDRHDANDEHRKPLLTEKERGCLS